MSTARLTPLAVWQAVAPYRGMAVLVLSVMLADAVLASLGIGMILPVMQTVLSPERSSSLLTNWMPAFSMMSTEHRTLWLTGVASCVFALKFVVGVINVALTRRFTENMRAWWVARIGERLLLGPFSRAATEKHGALLNNWFHEPATASRFLLIYLGYMTALFLIAGLLVLGLFISWKTISIFALVAACIVFGLGRGAFRLSARHSSAKLELHQALGATMSECLVNLRDVKILRAERARLSGLDDTMRQLTAIFVRMGVLGEVPRLTSEFLTVVALMAGLAIAVVSLRMPVETVMPLVAFFFVALYRLITAFSQAMASRMRALNDYQSLLLVDRLSREPMREEGRSGAEFRELISDLELRGIRFGYSEHEPIFDGLDLRIPKGQITFLVGTSGSGKSTLVDLLMRLHRPQGGRLLANSRDAEEFDLAQWRSAFGYVSQDAALFNGTIRMNLQLGKPGASEEEMREALNLASAWSFIQAFPQGLDTAAGDRGTSLSGGQRKRIAIARAIIHRPQVLILDEATTSFEQVLERGMIHRIRQALPHLTVIQITHRLQTTPDADNVIVLDQGKVLAAGTWDEVSRCNLAMLRGDHG